MPAWFLHWWYGYLWIRLEGYSPERFLNLCCSNKIELWDLQYREHGYQFYMTVKGYKKIKPLVKKTKVRLHILSRFGLPFFLYRNRKRKLFFTGFFCFFVTLFMMSFFIWDIRFEGNRSYTDENLMDFLESEQIYYGMRKSGVDCDLLEENIRSAFPEITWVSARVSGTRLIVHVKENEVLSQIPEKNNDPCDLIAEKNGVITRMVVRSGVAQVSVGDQVETGQVLVSGMVPITNDAEEIVNYHYVAADADIYARTASQVEQEFSSVHTVEVQTGKAKKGVRLRAFSHSLILMIPSGGNNQWNYVIQERQARLFENFFLPFYADLIEGKEYQVYEKFYTQEEKKQVAERLHGQIMKNLMEKGVQIIENNVKILDIDSGCRVESQFILEEPLGTKQTINITEEMKEPDEYH